MRAPRTSSTETLFGLGGEPCWNVTTGISLSSPLRRQTPNFRMSANSDAKADLMGLCRGGLLPN